MINYFVCGLSGAGKDTVSNYLVNNHEYMKLRIADTIKRIICEAKNLTFNELEEQKRINPELRTLHNIVSKTLDEIAGFEQSSTNRLQQLINGTALDYQHIKGYVLAIPKVICDCRTFEEASILLNSGWTGIFLTRTSKEFKDSTHFTEQNMFYNGELRQLQETYNPVLINIIFNDDLQSEREVNLLPSIEQPLTNYYKTTGDDNPLLEVIRKIVYK